jgi:transcriptional regulator with PAS, ATPase and Fis domain
MDKSAVMIGRSAALKGVEAEINRAAGTDAKVLITGESGVGKEIVAHLLHERSNRARAPFITINCAGFPETLLETELFGHVKGSFTDAYRDKKGWLEVAHGGTIFMDEVGEMSLRMQALLLRFLETGEIQRVGSDRRLPPVDVRVITATHRRLIDSVADKTFREDLYYRLNVIHIEVPPLRERPDDVGILLHHFLQTFAEAHSRAQPGVSPDVLACLESYPWPGNVRELRNVAERLVLRCQTARIEMDIVPPEVRRGVHHFTPHQASKAPEAIAPHQVLFDRLTKDRASFWSEVYEPLMARDLTRSEVRELIRLGLEQTRGNYKLLVALFNMPSDDYKRFLHFLRKYQCHVPFQRFRMMPASLGHSSSRAVGG